MRKRKEGERRREVAGGREEGKKEARNLKLNSSKKGKQIVLNLMERAIFFIPQISSQLLIGLISYISVI